MVTCRGLSSQFAFSPSAEISAAIRGLLDHCHAQWLALAGRWGKITMQTTMNRSSTIDAL